MEEVKSPTECLRFETPRRKELANITKRLAVGLAALILLASIAWRYNGRRAEDFVYYYCAGLSLKLGFSPYAPHSLYQACLAKALGPRSLAARWGLGCAYPPQAVLLLRRLADAPYFAAFHAWSALLGAASVLLAAALYGAQFSQWPLLFTWPGFILCWAYHKAALPVFLAFWAGLKFADGKRPLLGGVLLGISGIEPQWLAAGLLYLALRKNVRALGTALAVGVMPVFSSPGALSGIEWLHSAATHIHIATLDNQGLLWLLYKNFGPWPQLGDSGLLVLRAALFMALMAPAAFLLWKKGRQALPLYLALYLLASPYSHGSDLLWVFPLFATVVNGVAERWALSKPRELFLGLSVNGAIAALSAGYAPAMIADPVIQGRQGPLTLILAGAWALSSAFASRLPRE